MHADQSNQSRRIRYFLPLIGFVYQSNASLELSPGVWLARISEQQRALVLNSADRYFTDWGISGAGQGQVIHGHTCSTDHQAHEAFEETAYTAMRFLHLFSIGFCGFSHLGLFEEPNAIPLHYTSSIEDMTAAFLVRTGARLECSMRTEELEFWWSRLVQFEVAQGARLRQIIRRFYISRTKVAHSEDRLLDLVIAIESLFGDKEAASEVAYKCRLRAAAALGGQLPASSVSAFVKNAYSHRSRVAHGSLLQRQKFKDWMGGPCSLDDFIMLLDFVVRTSILAVIRRGNLPEWDSVILKLIDDQLFCR